MSKKDKPRELTEMQKAFLSFLFEEAEGDVRRAMDLAGYSKSTRVSEVTNSLAEEISELSLKSLSSSSAQAVLSLLSVLRTPHQNGAANRLKAAQQILDRAGVQKKTDSIDLKIPENGIVILPAKATYKQESEEEE